MQPYLFPYVGYYQLMHAVDRFVVADDVTFIKQGWINRNRLLINGSAAYFTVPLKRHPADALIKDVEIDDRQGKRWRGTMLKTIANFYRRTPSFAPPTRLSLPSPTPSPAWMIRRARVLPSNGVSALP